MARDIRPDVINAALSVARESDADVYRRREMAWLESEFPLAKLAVDAFVLEEHNDETQAAGRLGLLLGGSVLRGILDAEEFEPSVVRTNHGNELFGMKFAYPRELPLDMARSLFGDGGDAFGGIRHPAARSLCTVFLAVSLINPKPYQIADYVVFPNSALRKNRPRNIRRQARP